MAPPTRPGETPQPHPSRITPFAGHPIVVGVTPTAPELVIRTAAEWALALGVTAWFAYVDPTRSTEEEFADGSVRHVDTNPDLVDDDRWQRREAELVAVIQGVLAGSGVDWRFRYLAGRPDRALTHLARTVDAAAIVVGTRTGTHGGLHGLLEGAVGQHLAHHQHRPVLLVPLAVVDWKARLA